jgi:hypothetical protein
VHHVKDLNRLGGSSDVLTVSHFSRCAQDRTVPLLFFSQRGHAIISTSFGKDRQSQLTKGDSCCGCSRRFTGCHLCQLNIRRRLLARDPRLLFPSVDCFQSCDKPYADNQTNESLPMPLCCLQSDRGHPEGMRFETMYNLVPKAGVLTRSSTQYTFYTAVAELVVSTLDG